MGFLDDKYFSKVPVKVYAPKKKKRKRKKSSLKAAMRRPPNKRGETTVSVVLHPKLEPRVRAYLAKLQEAGIKLSMPRLINQALAAEIGWELPEND